MDARSLDQVANDLPAVDMLDDDAHRALLVHPIIQSRHSARAWQRRKPTARQTAGLGCEDLPDKDVRALRAASKAALPHELRLLPSPIRFERRPEGLVKNRRSATVPALGPSADHDPKPAICHFSGA
jgi:hypothetical protein